MGEVEYALTALCIAGRGKGERSSQEGVFAGKAGWGSLGSQNYALGLWRLMAIRVGAYHLHLHEIVLPSPSVKRCMFGTWKGSKGCDPMER